MEDEEMANGLGLAAMPRKKAWTLCRNYLQGAWANIEQDEIIIKQISGGLSNHLYYCGLPKQVKPKGLEPSEVLLRLFGKHLQTNSDSESSEYFISAMVLENVIFTLLSERNLGPKLMGVFAGGRLEEFIQAKTMVGYQVCEKKYSIAIARKLARIHRLNVPINKNSNWLLNILERWSERVSGITTHSVTDRREKEIAKRLLSIDYNIEISWLRKFILTVNSPVVFSHNDLQGGNVLCRQLQQNVGGIPSTNDTSEVDERLVVIDFEFCSYNYRAFDIANHWAEWMYDYGNEESPYYNMHRQKYPSKQQQVDFLRDYVEAYFDDSSDTPPSLRRGSLTLDQQLEVILKEVHAFQMIPHLLWGLWSIKNSVDSKILFGYWEYAADRIDNYFATKKALLEQLQLAENEVPLKVGVKRAENEVLETIKKRHLSLETQQIERWNLESNQ